MLLPRSFAQTIEREGNLFKLAGWKGAADLRPGEAPKRFSVRVDSQHNLPAVLGSYRVETGILVFEPRFPLQPGVRYRALFFPPSGGPPVAALFDIPRLHSLPTTRVATVYPSAQRLPENQLKFYLHFSAPMSRGEAYGHVYLLDEQGRKLALPFLELDEELWNSENQRLTIFFDPGRIKRGLVPHNEVGPPLLEGKRYTLVINADWKDAEGNPLVAGLRKPFSVGPADRTVPDPKNWKLTPPKAGSREPVSLDFAEPMDRALLERKLRVTCEGQTLAGSAVIDREESRWVFTPRATWTQAECAVEVDTSLADLAGNSLDHPFEVDRFERIEPRRQVKVLRLPFFLSLNDFKTTKK